MEFPIQSHLKLTSAREDCIISQVATSLMEWRGQQHAKGLVGHCSSKNFNEFQTTHLDFKSVGKRLEQLDTAENAS